VDAEHREGPKQSRLGVIARLLLAIGLAYPLSGALYAIVGIIKLAFLSPWAAIKNLPIELFMIFLWMLMVPSCAGFVPQNEGDVGPRINMYPWIIPTAAVLFFVLSAGWRWFRRKPLKA
jgi:uncharacterized iron-regulated membrane protein